jgi:hypothetical protein
MELDEAATFLNKSLSISEASYGDILFQAILSKLCGIYLIQGKPERASACILQFAIK